MAVYLVEADRLEAALAQIELSERVISHVEVDGWVTVTTEPKPARRMPENTETETRS